MSNCLEHVHGRIVLFRDETDFAWRVCTECGDFVDWSSS